MLLSLWLTLPLNCSMEKKFLSGQCLSLAPHWAWNAGDIVELCEKTVHWSLSDSAVFACGKTVLVLELWGEQHGKWLRYISVCWMLLTVNLKIILIILFLKTLISDESWNFWPDGTTDVIRHFVGTYFSHNFCIWRFVISIQNKGTTFPEAISPAIRAVLWN